MLKLRFGSKLLLNVELRFGSKLLLNVELKNMFLGIVDVFLRSIKNALFLNTVKPLITNTSEEFIKCRLDNFSMGFILYYVNFSICENK